MTRLDARKGAKRWAQVPIAGGVQIIIGDGDDPWNEAIDQAQVQFSRDRPNVRIVHATVATAAFRQVVSGTGSLAALTGLDAWVPGGSYLRQVWHPYLTTTQAADPLDPNSYRMGMDPGGVVLVEFLESVPQSGDVIRLEFVNPHVVHEDDATKTTVLAGDAQAFKVLVAYYILVMAAARAAQNTGNSGLPTDIVDRRSQSDIFKSRATDLWNIYAAAVGIQSTATSVGGQGGGTSIGAASGFKDLDVSSSMPAGFLWHRSRQR